MRLRDVTERSNKPGRTASLSALVLLTLAITGCGNGLASVTGHVTLDGVPLAGSENVRGMVYFYPAGGTGAPAASLLDSEGAYRVQTGSQAGIEPGDYLVSISASELIPSKVPGEAPGGRPTTPRRYADPSKSGFRVSVSPGSNEFDFNLEKSE